MGFFGVPIALPNPICTRKGTPERMVIMNTTLLETLANVVALTGIAVCAVAGISRLLGSYHVLGYEAMTLFIGGMSLMVFAALIKLQIIKGILSSRR